MTKRLALAALLLAIAVALYFLTRPTPRDAHESVPQEPPTPMAREGAATPSAAAVPREQPAPTQADAGTTSSEAGRPQAPAEQAKVAERPVDAAAMSPASQPQPIEEITGPDEELENVQFMVRGYRDVLGENPFGNNAEITRALMGENARQVKMPLPVGSHLNENGELADRWGTPYFFHQLSGTEMEIRSAGMDQQMWTSDDLVTR